MPKHSLGQSWNPCRDDPRYRITLTATGQAKARYALSFADERLGDFATLGAATLRAIVHKSCRNGSAVVVNVP